MITSNVASTIKGFLSLLPTSKVNLIYGIRNNIRRKMVQPRARVFRLSDSKNLKREKTLSCWLSKRAIRINNHTHATIIPRYATNNTPHTERNKSTPSSSQRAYDNHAAIRLAIKVNRKIESQNERDGFDVRNIATFSKGVVQVKTLLFFASPMPKE